MAEKKKEDEPKPWTPDQPLPDAADEEEAQVRSQRSARQKFLEEQHSKPAEKSKKKLAW
jgi:hypothetical protein